MKNVLLLFSFWLLATTAYATRYYVKTNGNDNNTGQSWNTAFATLQKALETTTGNNDEIWVAAGKYYPTNGADRFKTFHMQNGVAIYGGFAGTENTLTDRAAALIHSTNKTTLSGDVDLDGLLDDENVYQVIRNEGVDNTAQLDGFTISDGNANGSNTYQYGGGMYNSNASPTVTNCRFTNNRADSGGGLAILASTPKLIRCVFSGNTAVNGAGVMNTGSSSIFTNCGFSGNKATGNGGGINIQSSNPVFTNCSFSGSQAVSGGAMHTSGISEIKMRNCLVWGNNTELYPTASGGDITYTFTHTIVKGMNNGSGIFDGTQDPNFIAQPDQYAVPTTVGNMQLAICSPARNAGDNTVFTAGQTPDLSAITTDLAGNSRIFNTTVDLGAYEMQSVGTTLYVKSDGDDSNDGLSWGTAVKTLQKALDFVCRDKQIWVAAGTYYPTEGSGRDKTFKMKGWVTIYGGFAGTETTLADRVSSLIHTTNKTTLSGDVDEDGLLDAENVYHVIHNRAIGHNAQIDGFTISDGYANGIATGHYGGGMLNINSSPTVTNCRFTNNRGDYGGGMCNRANSSPTITNCSFIGNFGGDGGGLYDLQSPSYIITDCLFSNNTATSGGGMYITGATHTLIRCVFSGNTVTNQGAGVMAVSSASLFTNCSFLGNKANNQGGGFFNFKANPVFTNCSFSGNKAPRGGGIDAYEGLTSDIKLRNCIVWGNDPEIHPTASGGNVTYTFTNTIVKEMNNGSGILEGTQDPLFVSQPDYNAAPTTIGNLQLQYCSPAVDIGNNAVFNAGQTPDLSTITTDLAGNSRIFNNTVDLGAYERQLDNSLTIHTNLSNPTTCGGTNGSITISGLLINTSYSVTYTKDAASPQTLSLTSDSDGRITLENLMAGSYTNLIATYGSCVSNAVNVTLNDPDKPTLVLGAIPAVCLGTTGVSLPFSDLAFSPNQYSLDYHSTANAAGFTDIFQAALPASPLALPIPPTASATAYTASLTVRNSTTGCSSLPQNIVISINPQPVGPTLNVKTPNATSICFGTGVSATFNNGSGGVGCADDFILIIDNGTPVAYTPGSIVGTNATTSIVIQGRRANCDANSGCNGTNYVTLANWSVNPQPVGPMLNAKTPTVSAICFGTGVSATFNNGSGGIGCSDDFILIIDNGTPVTYTPGSTVGTNATASIVIRGRRANCDANSGCNGTNYVTLAGWSVNPLPTATISGTVTVCQNAPAPNITFTGNIGTAPYTFTYKINDVANPPITTISGNNLTVPQSTANAGIVTYSLVSVSDGNNCAQNQSGSATVIVNTKPAITLIINGQTFNEGNIQTLCDTDANPVNPLQLTVTGSCVSGPVLWSTQAGAGAWSDWSVTAPSSQPSSNIAYKYQAACDAVCPSTLSGIITLTINYRAATPQNVSLVADGTSVAAGQSATICNLAGNTLLFNATCGAGEVLLYSVDGGDYTAVVPSQIIDNNFHNYRVRCRKADGTPSCVETESAVMSLKITNAPAAPNVSIAPTSGCGTPTIFSGNAACGSLNTIWYNAATNQALPNLPTTTPSQTTSYYARCKSTASAGEAGCESEKSNVITFTITPVNDAPVVTVSAELVCAGTEVTVSTTCPAGTTALWNTGVTEASFKVAFNNVTKATYSAKCISANDCQSPLSTAKTVFWKAFELTFINVGQSKSATKTNDKAAWAPQFITPDAGPELDYSTEANPTIYFSENVNKTAPRFWTIHAEICNLGTDGSLTFNLLATPELGVIRSYNTHENNAPYFMYANREGFTELYAQNHPAYGFFADNGNGGNVYDDGLPKGLYKLGVRYWDQKGQGSIYPSTRQPAGNILTYQEYWFRIQSSSGIGAGATRITTDNGQRITNNGSFAEVAPNPVSNTLHLKVSDAKDQKVNVSLLDASGRALLQRTFVPETHQHQEEFGVSHFADGVYFLRIHTSEKQAVLKVVKVP